MSDTLEEDPYEYHAGKDDFVEIRRHGRVALRLKGQAARKFLAKVSNMDFKGQQMVMAKITGQYKFGNEAQKKSGKRHR